MRPFLTFVGLILAFPAVAQDHDHDAMAAAHHGSPEAVAEVRAVIDRLFDGMRAGDSTIVRSVFAPEVRLVSTMTREGVPMHRATPADAFVVAVGTPHEQQWDERVWNVSIDVRDNLASAWMDFAFFAGEQFSHCGVNAIHLVRGEDGSWLMVHIADTRRPAAECTLPDDVRG